MAELARLNIVVNAAAAHRALGSFNSAVAASGRRVGAVTRGMAGAFNSVRSAVFSLQGALVGLGAGLSVNSIVQTTLQAERLRTAFAALDGDADQAARTFNQLRARSNELGVDFMATAESYKVFGLASRAAGVDLNETNRIFNAFLTAGAAMKMSNDDLEGSLRAVGQMFSKGNVQAEELRGQLGERLPVAFSMAAESMGVTTSELGKMLENGEVLAVDLVPKLATALQEKFGQAAIEASYSATAQFNRFGNTITDLKIALGESGLVGALADLATNIQTFVRSEKFSEWVHGTILGFADFIDGIFAVYNSIGDIGKGITTVYEHLRTFYNTINQWTGGYLVEMGLLGYILMGKRKGGFIGIMIALLATAADELIVWATSTMSSIVAAVKDSVGSVINTQTVNNDSYDDWLSKQIYGNVGNVTREQYNQGQLNRGLTMNADGSFSGTTRSSMVPGAVGLFDGLQATQDYLDSQAEAYRERELGFNRVMDDAFDALYEAAGLTPSGDMGGMPTLTTPSATIPDDGLRGAGYPGDSIRGWAALLRQKMNEAFAANNNAGGFGTTPGTLPDFTGGVDKELQKTIDKLKKLDEGLIRTWDDLKFFMEEGGNLAGRFGDGVKQGFEKALISAVDLKQAGLDVVTMGFNFLDSAIDGFIQGTKVNFKQFAVEMLSYLAKLQVRMLMFKALSGTVMGDFLGIPSDMGFGQSAGGGQMQRGQPYLVGERGPEMFYPRTSGYMQSNDRLGGGGVVINQNFDFSNADEAAAAKLQATAQQIKAETFNAVFGSIEQGGRFAKATGRR